MYASSKPITGASRMQITEVQDQAIQARMAFIVGAKTFDRLFAGIRFDEADGPLLYAYAGTKRSRRRSRTTSLRTSRLLPPRF
jgi:hypothetical protein